MNNDNNGSQGDKEDQGLDNTNNTIIQDRSQKPVPWAILREENKDYGSLEQKNNVKIQNSIPKKEEDK